MPYLLTVSRMDFSVRRQRWVDPSHVSEVREIGSPQLPDAYPGALVMVDDNGSVCRSVPLPSPKGMLRTDVGLLVACYAEVRSFSADLDSSHVFASEPWCNDLHSLRPSPQGVAVAVAGIDAAFELSLRGTTQWAWWAMEHGYATNHRDEPWGLGKNKDHRRFTYPVEMQSTHINAIAAIDNATFVATLFHCGQLVAIDRESGGCSVLMEGLGRPHAVRTFGENMLTFVNTTAGEAILARVDDRRLEVLERIDVGTSWLHDAHFDGERWTFVDGATSRVLHADDKGDVSQIDVFDPEWCLYETLPWSANG